MNLQVKYNFFLCQTLTLQKRQGVWFDTFEMSEKVMILVLKAQLNAIFHRFAHLCNWSYVLTFKVYVCFFMIVCLHQDIQDRQKTSSRAADLLSSHRSQCGEAARNQETV